MIKVKEVRQHRIPQHYSYYETHSSEPSVLVTEAKLVLVKDISGILAIEGNGKINIVPGAPNIPSIKQFSISTATLPITYYKPIWISETEKIEVGDWVLTEHGLIYKVEYVNNSLIGWKKILALPEHFSPEQLSQIVSRKLKEGDIVLLEVEKL